MFGINDNIEMILDGVSGNDHHHNISVYCICFDTYSKISGTVIRARVSTPNVFRVFTQLPNEFSGGIPN